MAQALERPGSSRYSEARYPPYRLMSYQFHRKTGYCWILESKKEKDEKSKEDVFRMRNNVHKDSL